jgi:hypothetical protein
MTQSIRTTGRLAKRRAIVTGREDGRSRGHPKHAPAFRRALGRRMPDYEALGLTLVW